MPFSIARQNDSQSRYPTNCERIESVDLRAIPSSLIYPHKRFSVVGLRSIFKRLYTCSESMEKSFGVCISLPTILSTLFRNSSIYVSLSIIFRTIIYAKVRKARQKLKQTKTFCHPLLQHSTRQQHSFLPFSTFLGEREWNFGGNSVNLRYDTQESVHIELQEYCRGFAGVFG